MKGPAKARESYALAEGVVALSPGLAWLPGARALIAADAHLAYEDVVGAALPLWSTVEIAQRLTHVARRMNAAEIVFLGDIVHGPQMNEGAVRAVRAALDGLRAVCAVTLVAGNHEGRSRAFAVLGETVDSTERDGWLLVHGDGAAALTQRALIGHLHPSLHLGGGASVPAFVASDRLVVVPALNPYSPGLDVLSDAFAAAIGAWNVARRDAHVVASRGELVYPFGSLAVLRTTLRAPQPPRGRPMPRRGRRLGPDR
jgi:metallophosphoesterase superfamily enzyme